MCSLTHRSSFLILYVLFIQENKTENAFHTELQEESMIKNIGLLYYYTIKHATNDKPQ